MQIVHERTKKELNIEKKRCKQYQSSTLQVRHLFAHSVHESENEKRKRLESDAFLQRLGNFDTNDLDHSAVPENYTFYPVDPGNPSFSTFYTLISSIVHTLEVEKLRIQSRKLELENTELKSRLEYLLKVNVNIKASQKQRINKAESVASVKQTQLIGSLRRIKYLVSENKVTKAAQMSQEQYVSKLETKLLELNAKVKAQQDNARMKALAAKERSRMQLEQLKTHYNSPPSSPFNVNISYVEPDCIVLPPSESDDESCEQKNSSESEAVVVV